MNGDKSTCSSQDVENRSDGGRKRSNSQQSDPDGQNGSEDIREVENVHRENTKTVDLPGTGMVEAAANDVSGIDKRFSIVSSVRCQHEGGQHGQVGGGEQQGGHE